MSIKFGEIDTSQILENEFRIMVLERVIEKVINASPNLLGLIDMREIKQEVVAKLQKKYPKSGLELKG